MKYEVRRGRAALEISAVSFEEAKEQAEQWIADGDWDTSTGTTIWVRGYLSETDDNGDETSHPLQVAIDPPEPQCVHAGGHDWQAPHRIVGGSKECPGVSNKGGGVSIQEVCVRCGCGKLTDTWAENPETGEQGLYSVSYQPGKYEEALRASSTGD